MPTTETDRLHVLITGLVQGVGFRHATLLQAQSLRLNGWVRNSPDGRVEAHFEGDRTQLEAMLAWCHRGPHLSNVRKVEADWTRAPSEFESFRISF